MELVNAGYILEILYMDQSKKEMEIQEIKLYLNTDPSNRYLNMRLEYLQKDLDRCSDSIKEIQKELNKARNKFTTDE